MKKKEKNKLLRYISTIFLILLITLVFYTENGEKYLENIINTNGQKIEKTIPETVSTNTTKIELENIPQYDGKLYVEINNNIPYFNENDYTTESFEKYSELDVLGRCGVAYANVCKEIMPPERR
mgnify:FL=1